MHIDAAVNPWQLAPVARLRGGRLVVPKTAAPLGRMLPYRRAAGEAPLAKGLRLRRDGWAAELRGKGLGDMLLGLGLAKALADATSDDGELTYRGSRTALMERCDLRMWTRRSGSGHRIVHRSGGQRWTAVPETPPIWLDALDDETVEVHAALGMRHYLDVEQRLGIKLPAPRAPLPHFTSSEARRSGHIVFISATSWPDRKNYGLERFSRLAEALAERAPAPCTFTLVTGTGACASAMDGIEIQSGLEAADCLDIFASAQLVIGNDTGLTHLAALTRSPTGAAPEVVGLYARHAHTKWITGVDNHHAMATMFPQMLAAADRCPVRDGLDDHDWGGASRLSRIGPGEIADFAADLMSWRLT